MSDPRGLGAAGEQRAAEYLQKEGYRILGRNVRTTCEIDIICEQEGRVCFVEVKTRQSERRGLGREAVDARRQERYRMGALVWLRSQGLTGVPMRFDVIEITVGGLVHLKNAF